MKRAKVIAASTAFVGLALVKMIFPDIGAGMRTKLLNIAEQEPDYVAAFRDLGRKLSLQKESHAEVPPLTAETQAPVAKAQVVSYYVEDAAVSEEKYTPEQPAAVAAFLERQAAFADETLPENVDYGYEALPFDYVLPVAGRQSSGFGFRLHPILQTVRFHYGTDVAAWSGETIAAFADGTVIFSGYDDSFGWHLKLDHGGGWVSHYCHCSKLLAEKGRTVRMGDPVALVGSTGLATGPHLHFELTHDGTYVNPEYYLNA